MHQNKYFPHYGIPGLFIAYDKTGNRQTFYCEGEAKDFSEKGSVIDYKGFQIATGTFKIFKDGKAVFTAPWQDCDSLDKAKEMIDVSIAYKTEESSYVAFQLNKYGDVVKPIEATPDGEMYESGLEELNRLADYMNAQSEIQQHEREY